MSVKCPICKKKNPNRIILKEYPLIKLTGIQNSIPAEFIPEGHIATEYYCRNLIFVKKKAGKIEGKVIKKFFEEECGNHIIIFKKDGETIRV